MPSKIQKHSDPAALGLDLVDAARNAGLDLRLFGGVAIRVACGERLPSALRRPLGHLDLIGRAGDHRAVSTTLLAAGLRPDPRVGALFGAERQVYLPAEQSSFRIDVVLGRFRMNHELDCEARLAVAPYTLSPADLLLTKLQIVERAGKDTLDTAALLLTHELDEVDREWAVNVSRISEVCAGNWGLFTTVQENLGSLADRLAGSIDDRSLLETIRSRAAALSEAVDEAPKSMAWKARARVGRAKRWYDLPEAIDDAADLLPPLALGPVHVPAAYEVVLEQLHRAVNAGDYLPGERLPPERALADMLGVSRTVVQQALRVLQGEGIIEIRRGGSGGAFVADPINRLEVQAAALRDRLPEFEAQLDFRLAIEPRSAALAAERRSLHELQILSRSLDDLEVAGEDARRHRADSTFHLTIAAASRNEFLRKSFEELRGTAASALTTLTPDLRRASLREHRPIFEAIRAGDASEAEHTMSAHLQSVRDEFRTLTNQKGSNR
jgi:GntR family transcriptional repressor for pyruvate dehydrogenase complex